jgi:hypothetical protein
MTPHRLRPALYGAAVALATLAAACGDSSSPSTGLTDEQTSSLALTLRDEVESSASAVSVAGNVDPLARVGTAPNALVTPCATPSSTTDSDGDGIPDDAQYIFTAGNCTFTGYRGGTLTLSGGLEIQDPTPNAAGFAYVATSSGITATFDAPGQASDYTAIRSGVRALDGTPALLTLTDSASVQRTTGLGTAAIVRKWSLGFVPATPAQINHPIPSGAFTVDGTMSWKRGGETFAITVTTKDSLRYDATCTNTPQKIKAGEVRAAANYNNKNGYIRIVWSACGQDPQFVFQGS